MTTPPPAAPAFSFCGLRIFATRDATRVVGRVDYPYPSCGRGSVPVDYHSRRPSGEPADRDDDKARTRLSLIEAYRRLCKANPGIAKRTLARRVAADAPIKCSPRSLQAWALRYDTEGFAGLRDRYIKPPRSVLECSSAHARDALLFCAWWCFRIGGVDRIDTRMMAVAVGLIAAGYPIADLIATIDCYYSYPCDRRQYPFKPFARWCKYDLHKWVQRAAADADYIRALSSQRRERTALHVSSFTACPRPPAPPEANTRKLDARNRPTRHAIRSLARPVDSAPGRPPASSLSGHEAAAMSRWMNSLGQPHLARQFAGSIDTRMASLISSDSPRTVAESLATLDDAYRVVLINASNGDRRARDEALATLPIWWDAMPEDLRHNIDYKVECWRRDHPAAGDHVATQRKLLMLLPHVRNHRAGAQNLAVAARLPT